MLHEYVALDQDTVDRIEIVQRRVHLDVQNNNPSIVTKYNDVEQYLFNQKKISSINLFLISIEK